MKIQTRGTNRKRGKMLKRKRDRKNMKETEIIIEKERQKNMKRKKD